MKSQLRVLTSLGLLAAAIITATPSAWADTVTFTCHGDNNLGSCAADPGAGAVLAPNVTFPGPTLDMSWYGQTFDLTLPGTWQDSDSYQYLISNSGMFLTDTTKLGTISVFGLNTNLATTGAGISEFGTLAFATAVSSVPEPATLSLLALGLAGVGLLRRRKAA